MLKLDYQSRLPFYEQLYNSVIRLSSLGILQPDEQLPTVRALAKELGINPNTVQKAYRMLERDGFTYSVTGKGSFVSPGGSASEKRRMTLREALRPPLDKLRDAGFTREEVEREITCYFEEGGHRT